MKLLIIPTFEPEVIAAGAARYAGDDEKVATTSFSDIDFHGVNISSRCDKAHELRLMIKIVATIPASERGLIESVWCDSKAQACYTVQLKPRTKALAKRVASLFEAACTKHGGGYNFIDIDGAQGGSLQFDPSW